MEHREGCDLRASQGTLDSSPDFSEQQIAGQRDETVRCSSPSIIMAYTNDEGTGIPSSQAMPFHLPSLLSFYSLL